MPCTVLPIEFQSLAALHAAFMPLFEHGGLFVRGESCEELDRRYFLLLTLPGQVEPLAVLARSAWIQPSNNVRRRPAGVGLRFEPDGGEARVHIEQLLSCCDLQEVSSHTF